MLSVSLPESAGGVGVEPAAGWSADSLAGEDVEGSLPESAGGVGVEPAAGWSADSLAGEDVEGWPVSILGLPSAAPFILAARAFTAGPYPGEP